MNSYKRIIVLRENRLRMFQSLHQNDDPEFYRADGDSICSVCNLKYKEHPSDEEHAYLYYNGEVYDRRLCNGDIVHL